MEDSSGNRRRLGHITKQGNSLLRFLLVEAAQVTARSLPEWRSKYVHITMRRGRKIAKVAMARKLAVRLYWMMAQGMGLRAVEKVRFARGTARTSRWCEVKHRVIDWASRSPCGGVRSSNHDRRCDRRDAWVELSFRPKTITSGPLVGMAEPSTRAKWRALRSARSSTLQKCLTVTDIVRDAMLRQPSATTHPALLLSMICRSSRPGSPRIHREFISRALRARAACSTIHVQPTV